MESETKLTYYRIFEATILSGRGRRLQEEEYEDITDSGTLDVEQRTFTTPNNKVPGTRYRYKILAYNGVAWSEFSSPTEILIAAVLPDAPLNVAKASSGIASAGLSWEAPAYDGGTPVIGYKVYSNGGSGSLVFVEVVDTTELTFLHEGLSPTGTIY
jgi:hypothetical protein